MVTAPVAAKPAVVGPTAAKEPTAAAMPAVEGVIAPAAPVLVDPPHAHPLAVARWVGFGKYRRHLGAREPGGQRTAHREVFVAHLRAR